MANRLASTIRRHGIRKHFHAGNTAQRAPDPDELGALALLQ